MSPEDDSPSASAWPAYVTPANLAFRHLYYRDPQGHLRLRGVSGYVNSGDFVGILGGPGAEVSTLLRCLAKRLPRSGDFSGEILVNGEPLTRGYKRHIGLIEKDDIHLPTLTVKETLEFSARMCLKDVKPAMAQQRVHQLWSILSADDRPSEEELVRHYCDPGKKRTWKLAQLNTDYQSARVHRTLDMLGLSHVANTVVGNATLRGVSGGEKRRVSIGVESVAEHSIILADLPTNGLDSASALDLCTKARAAAKSGRMAMVFSVAQPSPAILNLFDNIMLMSKGSCVYFGPVSNVAEYFLRLGYTRPPMKSMPDFLQEVTVHSEKFWCAETAALHQPLVDHEEEEEKTPDTTTLTIPPRSPPLPVHRVVPGTDHLIRSYQQSELYDEVGMVLWRGHSAPSWSPAPDVDSFAGRTALPDTESFVMLDDEEDEDEEDLTNKNIASRSWFQLKHLMIRQLRISLRNRAQSVGRFIKAALLAVILGTLFFQLENSQHDARVRFSLIFFATAITSFGAIPTIPMIFEQRMVFTSQSTAGYFHRSMFFVAFQLMEVPFAAVESLLFTLILYALSGLQGGLFSGQFMFMWLVLFLVASISRAFTVLVSFVAKNQQMAQSIAPVFMSLFFIFSGFLVARGDIGPWWLWMYFASFLSYAFKGLSINEIWGLTWTCDADERVPSPHDPLFNLPYVDGGFEGFNSCPYTDEESVLSSLDLHVRRESDKYVMLLVLTAFWIGWNGLGLLAAVFVRHHPVSAPPARKKSSSDTPSDCSSASPCASINDEDASAPLLHRQALIDAGAVSVSVSELAPEHNSAVTCAFHGLCYDVGKKLDKRLLSDVFGFAEPGNMVALMGVSGAGKTTLLDVLAGVKTGGKVSGALTFNGDNRQKDFARNAAYVEQFDSHLPTQTVREAIEFSAALRLPSSVGDVERKRRVDEIIRELGLECDAGHIIGSVETGGVTPEVRKLTSIAVEIAADPGILFLDEPTTSLDSTSAMQVIAAVKQLSKRMSVLCTIHQPSSELFSAFDSVLLLQKGGRVAYFGQVMSMPSYFSEHGFGQLQQDQNVADFALECVNATDPQGRLPDEVFRQSTQGLEILARAERSSVCGGDDDVDSGAALSDGSVELTHVSESQQPAKSFPGLWSQLSWCTLREWRHTTRTTGYKTKWVACWTIMLVLGTMYWQLDMSQRGAFNRMSLFFMVVLSLQTMAAPVIAALIPLRPIYFREINSLTYNALPLYLSRVVVDIPFSIVQAVVATLILYFMSSLVQTWEAVAVFALILFACILLGRTFTEIWATVMPTADTANAITIFLLVLFLLVAGFLIPPDAITRPAYVTLYAASYLRYGVQSLAANEFTRLEGCFSCPDNQGATAVDVTTLTPDAGLNLPCHTINATHSACTQYYCPVQDPLQMLRAYGITEDGSDIYPWIGILFGFWAGFRLLAFVALKYINHIKR